MKFIQPLSVGILLLCVYFAKSTPIGENLEIINKEVPNIDEDKRAIESEVVDEVTTIVSREKRQAVNNEVDANIPSSEDLVTSTDKDDHNIQFDAVEATTVESRAKRDTKAEQPTTISYSQEESLNDEEATTPLSRAKRDSPNNSPGDIEVTSINPDISFDDPYATTEIATRIKREADDENERETTTKPEAEKVRCDNVEDEEIISTTEPNGLSDRVRRSIVVSNEATTVDNVGIQFDEAVVTTPVSEVVRNDIEPTGENLDTGKNAKALIFRFRREISEDQEATTSKSSEIQFDDPEISTMASRIRRDIGSNENKEEESMTETSYLLSMQDIAATTVQSRVRRDVSLDDMEQSTPEADHEQINFDDVEKTTSKIRSRREISEDDEEQATTEKSGRELVISNDLEETTTARVYRRKREVSEDSETFTTLSPEVGSYHDETEVVTNDIEEIVEKKANKEDELFIIKYPEPPKPNPEYENLEPPKDLDVVNKDTTVPTQAVITGNLSCECGKPITRIVGGENASISEFPWTVALVRVKNGVPKGPYCGGTLVSDKYIVTASHCVDRFKPENIQVWLNKENLRDPELNGTIIANVEEIIMHPEYNAQRIRNDIALLKLDESIDLEDSVRPACLPADDSNTFEDTEGIVTGWGATEQGGEVASTLQKVTVPILSNKVCNWRTVYLGRITEDQVCAGELGGGKDSCQGDSGGPMVVSTAPTSQKVLVGVVSFGLGCAQPLAPGVYTRVSKYTEWIKDSSPDALYCSK